MTTRNTVKPVPAKTSTKHRWVTQIARWLRDTRRRGLYVAFVCLAVSTVHATIMVWLARTLQDENAVITGLITPGILTLLLVRSPRKTILWWVAYWLVVFFIYADAVTPSLIIGGAWVMYATIKSSVTAAPYRDADRAIHWRIGTALSRVHASGRNTKRQGANPHK